MNNYSRGDLSELYLAKRQILEQGETLIDLSMINPDIPPPRILIDRLAEATHKQGSHRYSVSRGVRKLRVAFAQKYETTFGVDLSPESQVCITLGTKDAVTQALTVLDYRTPKHRKNILMLSPSYRAHLFAVSYSGFKPFFVDISSNETKILEDIESQLNANNISVLLLNFPHNPTGQVVSKDFILKLVRICANYHCTLINDFVYGEMCFDSSGLATSVLSATNSNSFESPIVLNDSGVNDEGVLKADILEVYSLSKAYSVPGWRVGAVCGSEYLVREIARIKSKNDFGIFLPLQTAAATALAESLQSNLVGDIRSIYARRFDLMSKSLSSLGFEVYPAKAGCSIWAKLPSKFSDGDKFVYDLLQSGVAVLPGSAFGSDYRNYIRLALVSHDTQLREVCNRIEKVINAKLSSGCELESVV